jgi:hypothetical protein
MNGEMFSDRTLSTERKLELKLFCIGVHVLFSLLFYIYQFCNQKQQIEGHKTQWIKEKG